MRRFWIVLGVVGVLFLGMVGLTAWQEARHGTLEKTEEYGYAKLQAMAGEIDFSKYDLNKVQKGNEEAGEMGDNVKGNLEEAKVILFEYADYQCVHCAEMNQYINKIVQDYDGKVAVVFRSYVLSYSNNGILAAQAAQAAALQGYWAELKDLMFEKQDEWYYVSKESFQKLLEEYFEEVSGGKGDLGKFRGDMKSARVAQKIAFDMGAGEKMGLKGTPWFCIDGEYIVNNSSTLQGYVLEIREKINEKLKQGEK